MAVEKMEDVDNRLINVVSAVRSDTLDLSGKKICNIPKEILNLNYLESLHLQSNCITELPDGFFESLKGLKWLDLRNNRLALLPPSIGQHRSLRSLLLEGNCLTHLPYELGMTKSLCGLSLSGNPLEFPPMNIVVKGTKAILNYLQSKCEDSSWTNERNSPPSTVESDDECQDELLRAGLEYLCEDRANEGHSQTLQLFHLGTRKLSPLKLPPIVRNATTVRRSNSESDALTGQSVKKFEPERRLTWGTIKMSISGGKWSWMEGKKHERAAAVICEDVVMIPDEKPVKQERKARREKRNKNAKKHLNNMKDRDLSLSQFKCDIVTDKDLSTPVLFNVQDERPPDDELTDKCSNAMLNVEKEHVAAPFVVGDFVAIKVPKKHFIRCQPCVGKVVAEVDEHNNVLVHYYTGTYDGIFREMMSRTSPYLRKVSIHNVLCKFRLQPDGSLSPTTAKKLRKMIEP